MRTLFDAKARAQGLTFARARLLFVLARHDGVTQGELASLLEVEPPTMVRQLDGLERQGLNTRSAVEGDRRAKCVRLTERARKDAGEVSAFTVEMRRTALRGISDEDLATVVDVMRKMAANIEKAS